MTSQATLIENNLLEKSIDAAGVRIAGAIENSCNCCINVYIASQALLSGFEIGRMQRPSPARLSGQAHHEPLLILKETTVQTSAVGLGFLLLFWISSDYEKTIIDYLAIHFLARFVGKNLPF